MKAVLAERFGGPDVLRLTEVPDPFTPPGCVRIAVYAAGLNPVDAGNRVDGTWAGLTAPCILGYDVAGIVDEVGEGAEGALVGDRVMAMTAFPAGAGGYAEFAVVDAGLVAPVPPECSLVEAAGVPLAASTAFEVLERLGLAAESSVLVLGASGGVGTFLVQLGAAAGLRIAAVGSEPSTACCANWERPGRSTIGPVTWPRPPRRRLADRSMPSSTWSARTCSRQAFPPSDRMAPSPPSRRRPSTLIQCWTRTSRSTAS